MEEKKCETWIFNSTGDKSHASKYDVQIMLAKVVEDVKHILHEHEEVCMGFYFTDAEVELVGKWNNGHLLKYDISIAKTMFSSKKIPSSLIKFRVDIHLNKVNDDGSFYSEVVWDGEYDTLRWKSIGGEIASIYGPTISDKFATEEAECKKKEADAKKVAAKQKTFKKTNVPFEDLLQWAETFKNAKTQDEIFRAMANFMNTRR